MMSNIYTIKCRPTSGEQNKFDYLMHLHMLCSAAVLYNKRETDMDSGFKSVLVLTSLGQQPTTVKVRTSLSFFATFA